MAYSRVTYPSPTPGQTLFAVDFPYLAAAHVIVAINGVDTTDFTWATEAMIELDTGVSSGDIVQIRRESNRTARVVDFEDAGMVNEIMLDTSALQVIYIAQEAIDIAEEALHPDTDDKFDALSKVIKNVSDGIDSGDAVNLGQLLAAEMAILSPTAENIEFTPAGTISSADVQAAIEELDTAVSDLAADVALAMLASDNLSTLTDKQLATDTLVAGLSEDTAPSKDADSFLTVKAGVTKLVDMNALVRHEEVRQTVVAGSVNSTGQANFISAGTGLACNLAATSVPVVVTFAAGEDENGPVNYRKRIVADVSSFVSSLAATNRSYIYADRDTSTGALTYAATRHPPQYGYVFDKAKQSLLRFAGADASTTILDDYGNTWTAVADAQLDTSVQIDGLNTLLLDGTGDYIYSNNFTGLPNTGWTVELKHRRGSTGTEQRIVEFTDAGGDGVKLLWSGAADKLEIRLSSNGSSDDITSGAQSTSGYTSTATDYHIALTHDPVAGKYYVYMDGVKVIEVTSSAFICSVTQARIGASVTPAAYLNGKVAGFRFSPFCRYPNGTTFSAPDISTFAVEGDYFSIPEMKMYTVTAASGTAGTNPTMTQKHRTYMGEAVTDGSSVTSAITYALKGKYKSPVTTPVPAATTQLTFNHYIGCIPERARYLLKNLIAQHGYVLGDEVVPSAYGGTYVAPNTHAKTRLSMKAVVGATNDIVMDNAGSGQAVTKANWGYFALASRGW